MTYTSGQRVLDRFEIVGVLGKGGFGTTYSAVEDGTGREVAIKNLDLSRVNDWKAVELFEREAQTLEQLSHARIPEYIDFVPVADESSGLLIQSLAPGRSLAVILEEQGALTDTQIEAIAEQVLEILSYLANLNPQVVHRDIKPGNLLLDEDDQIYLVDFGAVQDAANRSAQGGSTVAGTFGYMAPEQLHGVATPRSDLYALGMTLIHLASGREPTSLGRDGLRVTFQDVVTLPGEFEEFLARLVEPNPDDRFQGPDEALAFLRREVPLAGTLSGLFEGASVADMIEHHRAQQARRRKQEEREELRRQEKLRKRAEKMGSSLLIQDTDEGRLVTIAPDMPGGVKWVVAGIVTFLLINPGVFVALHFYMGSLWPVVDEPTWEHTMIRWAIWALVLIGGAVVATIKLARPNPIRLHLTDKYFVLYGDNIEAPYGAGERTQLHLSTDTEGNDAPTGAAEFAVFTAGRRRLVCNHKIHNVPLQDLETLEKLVSSERQAPTVPDSLEQSVDPQQSDRGERESTEEIASHADR